MLQATCAVYDALVQVSADQRVCGRRDGAGCICAGDIHLRCQTTGPFAPSSWGHLLVRQQGTLYVGHM